MSDTREPTQEELIINRLAQRIGLLSAQNEILQMQLEQAHAELERLRSTTNGEMTHEFLDQQPSSERPGPAGESDSSDDSGSLQQS